MRDVILTVIILGFVPVILVRPYVGILAFACLGYLNPHRYTWGFAYTMPFSAIIGLATIIGFLFTKDKRAIPWTPLTVVWFAWILWMNVTTLFALVPDTAATEWERAMKIQLTSILAISMMQSKERLHYLAWVITFSVGWFGIKGGIFTALTGGNYRVIGPPGTFFSGNNGLAVALLIVMPMFWYLRSTLENKWLRLGMVVAMLLCAMSILGSYSRGATLGIIAVTVYLIFKSRHRWSLLPLVVVAGAIFLSFMPEKWFERIESVQEYEQDMSAMGRINAWRFAYNLASDRPLIGGGYGAFHPGLFQRYAPIPDDYHDSHSIYFEALGEHGFLGLGLFLVLGYMALRYANKIRKATEGNADLHWAYDLASMIQVSIVGYAVGGAFLGLAYFDLYYHLIVIIVLTHHLVMRHLESPLAEDAAEAQADPDNALAEGQTQGSLRYERMMGDKELSG